jgi:hypothetical protein
MPEDQKSRPEEWQGKARTAFGVNGIITHLYEMGILKRYPNPNQMQEPCSGLHWSLHYAPQSDVMTCLRACLADEDKRMTEQ